MSAVLPAGPHPVIRHRLVPLESTGLAHLHPLLQRVYAARGVKHADEVRLRLDQLPSPASLLGIERAVDLMLDAQKKHWRILIVGDYDADGATSTALGMLALPALGYTHVDYLVPDRFVYGYGLTPEIVTLARERRPDLIITVDNGISSIEGVAAAKKAGIRVLITDHHLPGDELPDADAIVNPNQAGCGFATKSLAGVGVFFYLLLSLRARLRQQDWFSQSGVQEPNLAQWLDLVALGTVADVVALERDNRILVHQGLQRIRQGHCRPGITALLRLAGRDPQRAVAADLGFSVGPRLNAAGRLDDMSIGIQCLLAESPQRAEEWARLLDQFNRDRRSIEADMQEQALKLLATLRFDATDELPWGLCLYQSDWHPGVVGLLASRIKDRVHRPVIAFADVDGNAAELKGSARSISVLHIRDVLATIAARHPGLISRFGGHAAAAGLSVGRDRLDEFKQAFDDEVRRQLKPADLQAEIWCDGSLEPDDFSLDTAWQLRHAGPWGQHFPEPSFEGLFIVRQQRLVGERHLKLLVSPTNAPTIILDAIAFFVDVDRWPDASLKRLRLVYKLDVNEFRGEANPQLLVSHLLPLLDGSSISEEETRAARV